MVVATNELKELVNTLTVETPPQIESIFKDLGVSAETTALKDEDLKNRVLQVLIAANEKANAEKDTCENTIGENASVIRQLAFEVGDTQVIEELEAMLSFSSRSLRKKITDLAEMMTSLQAVKEDRKTNMDQLNSQIETLMCELGSVDEEDAEQNVAGESSASANVNTESEGLIKDITAIAVQEEEKEEEREEEQKEDDEDTIEEPTQELNGPFSVVEVTKLETRNSWLDQCKANRIQSIRTEIKTSVGLWDELAMSESECKGEQMGEYVWEVACKEGEAMRSYEEGTQEEARNQIILSTTGVQFSRLERLREYRASLESTRALRQAESDTNLASTKEIWGRLGVDEAIREAHLSSVLEKPLALDTLSVVQTTLDELNVKLSAYIEQCISVLRANINQMREVLSVQYSNNTHPQDIIYDTLFENVEISDAVLEEHQQFKNSVQASSDSINPLLAMITKRDDMSTQLSEFESRDVDPNRFKRKDSFKILKHEEKMRKLKSVVLPKFEAKLFETVMEWQKKHVSVFTLKGEAYLEVLSRECISTKLRSKVDASIISFTQELHLAELAKQKKEQDLIDETQRAEEAEMRGDENIDCLPTPETFDEQEEQEEEEVKTQSYALPSPLRRVIGKASSSVKKLKKKAVTVTLAPTSESVTLAPTIETTESESSDVVPSESMRAFDYKTPHKGAATEDTPGSNISGTPVLSASKHTSALKSTSRKRHNTAGVSSSKKKRSSTKKLRESKRAAPTPVKMDLTIEEEEAESDVEGNDAEMMGEMGEVAKLQTEAESAYANGEYATAIVIYSLAIEQANLDGSTPKTRSSLLHGRSVVYTKLSKFREALEDSDNALTLSSTVSSELIN